MMKKRLLPIIKTPFPMLRELEVVEATIYAKLRHVPWTFEKKLWIAANQWLPCGAGRGWPPVVNHFCGSYVYHFVLRIEIERQWNRKEFREGRKFGRHPIEPFRDANPYLNYDLSRHRAWDAGYILGLAEGRASA